MDGKVIIASSFFFLCPRVTLFGLHIRMKNFTPHRDYYRAVCSSCQLKAFSQGAEEGEICETFNCQGTRGEAKMVPYFSISRQVFFFFFLFFSSLFPCLDLASLEAQQLAFIRSAIYSRILTFSNI